MALISLPTSLLALCAGSLFPQATALNLPKPNSVANIVPQLNFSTTQGYVSSLFRRGTGIALSDLDGFCDDDPHFMEMNPANLDESKPGQFYQDFMHLLKKNHTQEYKKTTGPTLFAKYGWHDPNFVCSMHLPGCVQVPTCRDVVRGISKARKLNRQDLTADLKMVARQEVFAAKKIDSMARFFNTIHQLSEEALLHIGNRMDEIVADFSPTADPKMQFLCKLVQEIADMYFSVGIAYLTKNNNAIVSRILQIMAKSSKNLAEQGLDGGLSAAARHTEQAGEKKSGKSRWFTVPQDYTQDRCSIAVQDYNIDKYGRGSKMKDHLSRESLNMTMVLEDTWDSLVAPGASVDTNNSTGLVVFDMGSWIDDTTWSVTWEDILKKMPKTLNNIVNAIGDHSISTIWRSDRCSVKCQTDTPDAQKWCAHKENPTKQDQSRYCPDERTVCQVQCHTVKKTNNNEKLLFGWDKLKKYGLSPEIVLRNSWQQRGEFGPPNERSALELIKEIPNYQRSMIALPVCSSPYTKITNFKAEHQPLVTMAWRNRDQAMACTCGDWRSSETRPYMESLGLDPTAPDFVNKNANELMKIICPHNLRKLPPVTNFLAFCELGIRRPNWGEPANVRKGEHHLCDTVKNRTEAMSEEEANVYFCRVMPERKDIFAHELPALDGAPVLPGHKRRCEKFMGAWKKGKSMQAFKEELDREDAEENLGDDEANTGVDGETPEVDGKTSEDVGGGVKNGEGDVEVIAKASEDDGKIPKNVRENIEVNSDPRDDEKVPDDVGQTIELNGDPKDDEKIFDNAGEDVESVEEEIEVNGEAPKNDGDVL